MRLWYDVSCHVLCPENDSVYYTLSGYYLSYSRILKFFKKFWSLISSRAIAIAEQTLTPPGHGIPDLGVGK